MNNSHHDIIKNFFTKDIGLKIFSLIMATFMWFLVMNTINPTETRAYNANITFENMDALINSGYVVNNQTYIMNSTVTIKVEGSRPALDEMSKPQNKGAISAKIDLSKLEIDENAEFPQKYQVSLVPSLPSGLYVYSYDIASYFPTVTELEIDRLKSTTAELQLAAYGNVKSGYIASEPEADIAEVEVMGPASRMTQVDSVVAAIDISEADRNITKQCTPVVYDKNKNELTSFFVNPENVNVSVKVHKENEISVNEPAVVGALPPHLKLDSITWEPKTIICRSDTDATPVRNSIDLPPVDLSKITKSEEQTVDISDSLRELGLESDVRRVSVNINVSVVDTEKYVIHKSDIKISGLAPNLAATITDDVTVEIGGGNVNTAELYPTVNLSGCRIGKNTIPLDLKLPNGATLKEKVNVNVLVTSKESALEPANKEADSQSETSTSPVEETTAPNADVETTTSDNTESN